MPQIGRSVCLPVSSHEKEKMFVRSFSQLITPVNSELINLEWHNMPYFNNFKATYLLN